MTHNDAAAPPAVTPTVSMQGVATQTNPEQQTGFPMKMGDTMQAAILTGLVYFAGDLYLDGRFGRLGVADTEIQFDVPYVMTNSLFPILMPIFLLFLFFAVSSSVQERLHGKRYLSVAEGVAVVSAFWAARVLFEVVNPAEPRYVFGYRVRDVTMFLCAVALLVLLYWRNWVKTRQGRFAIVGSAWADRLLFPAIMVIFVVGLSVGLTGRWPIEVIVGFPLLILLSIIWGVLASRILNLFRKPRVEANAEKGAESRMQTAQTPKAERPLMTWLVTALALMLAGSLSGTADANLILRGCEAHDTIAFHPAPPNVSANDTHMLILHSGGLYHVRKIERIDEQGALVLENATVAVPEDPARTATIVKVPGTAAC